MSEETKEETKPPLIRVFTENEIKWVVARFVVNEDAFANSYGYGNHSLHVEVTQKDPLRVEVFYKGVQTEAKIDEEKP